MTAADAAATPPPASRLRSLDVLRALAVCLVLGRHVPPGLALGIPALDATFGVWERGGWVGVDLFFVLSGFLVSGLLFREHARHGRLEIKRFLIRRGLKIYPPYYALLLLTLLGVVHGGRLTWSALVGDLLYLQNYVGTVWGHAWSLAVEEHFYLLLAGLFYLLARRSRGGADPFRSLPRLVLGTALLCLALRCSLLGVPYENETHLIPTHLRIDSLFFGVLLGYLHHRDPGLLIRGLPTRLLLGGLGALLVLPAFVLELQTSRYLYTLGFSALYLGNGLLLIAFLPGRFGGWFGRGAAAIGRHSYSIYLWHFPIRNLVEDHHAQLELSPGSSIALYLGGSLAVGIVGSKAIEVPILRLRDRLYPTRSGSLDVEGAATADHARPSARCAPPDGEPET